MSVSRMFIAGAKCPSCGLEDKLRLCRDTAENAPEPEWVECVRCDYRDVRPTSVDQQEPEPAEDGVVKFAPPR